jgi:hypothetical protein
MGFWEGYVAGLASNMTIELIKRIYERNKATQKITELKNTELSFLTDMDIMITALINMLKKAKYEVICTTTDMSSFTTDMSSFYPDPQELLSNLDYGISRVKFRIIYLMQLQKDTFTESAKFLRQHNIEIYTVPLNYQQALSTMRFVCIDKKECMILYSLPNSIIKPFGFYVKKPKLTRPFLNLFQDLLKHAIPMTYL